MADRIAVFILFGEGRALNERPYGFFAFGSFGGQADVGRLQIK